MHIRPQEGILFSLIVHNMDVLVCNTEYYVPCSFNESLLLIISRRVSFPYAVGFFKIMPFGRPSIVMPYSNILLYGIFALESFTC